MAGKRTLLAETGQASGERHVAAIMDDRAVLVLRRYERCPLRVALPLLDLSERACQGCGGGKAGLSSVPVYVFSSLGRPGLFPGSTMTDLYD